MTKSARIPGASRIGLEVVAEQRDTIAKDRPVVFYCRTGDGRVFVALFFLAWMGVLFWVMSKVAEDFLVPALEVRACM